MHSPNQSRCHSFTPIHTTIISGPRTHFFDYSAPPPTNTNPENPSSQFLNVSFPSPISWQGQLPVGVRVNHLVVRYPLFFHDNFPSENHEALRQFWPIGPWHDHVPQTKSGLWGASQVSSVQNPSIIPLNPGWFIGIPLLDYCNPQYIYNYIYIG